MSSSMADTAYRGESIKTSVSSSHTAILALFGFTVFCSSFLLFQVQLVIAKYILPWFGGTPAVFTTCMLFFQILLLIGYSYAYFIDRRLSPRTQAVIHSLLIILAVAALAFRLSTWGSPLLPGPGWKPSAGEHPLLHIVCLLFAKCSLAIFLGFHNRSVATGLVRPHLQRRALPPVCTFQCRLAHCSGHISRHR